MRVWHGRGWLWGVSVRLATGSHIRSGARRLSPLAPDSHGAADLVQIGRQAQRSQEAHTDTGGQSPGPGTGSCCSWDASKVVRLSRPLARCPPPAARADRTVVKKRQSTRGRSCVVPHQTQHCGRQRNNTITTPAYAHRALITTFAVRHISSTSGQRNKIEHGGQVLANKTS